jgi:uncharacterized protein
MKQCSGSPKRTEQKLSESSQQRLNSYTLAASAAGVSLLALVQPAEAIVQPIGGDAPEITARFRDPAGNVLGIFQQR